MFYLIHLSSPPPGPTLKLKRPVVMKMYADLTDQFYTDTETPRD